MGSCWFKTFDMSTDWLKYEVGKKFVVCWQRSKQTIAWQEKSPQGIQKPAICFLFINLSAACTAILWILKWLGRLTTIYWPVSCEACSWPVMSKAPVTMRLITVGKLLTWLCIACQNSEVQIGANGERGLLVESEACRRCRDSESLPPKTRVYILVEISLFGD